jgi:hypothetical protein
MLDLVRKVRLIAIIIFAGVFCLSAPVQASIYVNEVSPSTDSEWIELYNSDQNQVDLSGWRLADGNSSTNDDLNLSGVIPANGLIVFEHNKGWLNNSGDTVSLINNASPAAVIDIFEYQVVNEQYTVGRISDGQIITYNLIPSKGSPNNIPTATATPTQTPTPTSLTPAVSPTTTPVIISTITPTPTPTTKVTSPPKKIPTTTVTLGFESSLSSQPPLVLGVSSEPTDIPSPSPTAEQTNVNQPQIVVGWLAIIGGLSLMIGVVSLTLLKFRQHTV